MEPFTLPLPGREPGYDASTIARAANAVQASRELRADLSAKVSAAYGPDLAAARAVGAGIASAVTSSARSVLDQAEILYGDVKGRVSDYARSNGLDPSHLMPQPGLVAGLILPEVGSYRVWVQCGTGALSILAKNQEPAATAVFFPVNAGTLAEEQAYVQANQAWWTAAPPPCPPSSSATPPGPPAPPVGPHGGPGPRGPAPRRALPPRPAAKGGPVPPGGGFGPGILGGPGFDNNFIVIAPPILPPVDINVITPPFWGPPPPPPPPPWWGPPPPPPDCGPPCDPCEPCEPCPPNDCPPVPDPTYDVWQACDVGGLYFTMPGSAPANPADVLIASGLTVAQISDLISHLTNANGLLTLPVPPCSIKPKTTECQRYRPCAPFSFDLGDVIGWVADMDQDDYRKVATDWIGASYKAFAAASSADQLYTDQAAALDAAVDDSQLGSQIGM